MMTTEYMEVYSLERGDEILAKGNAYRILDIEDGVVCDYRLRIMDEEGYVHYIEADASDQLPLICPPIYEEV